MRVLALCLLLAACQGDDGSDTPEADPMDDTGTAVDTGGAGTTDTGGGLCDDAPVVTWENFGAGFLTENCQACHASTAPNRQGAPEAVVFDVEDDAFALADRILDRVLDEGDMPPQGGVTEDDRYLVEVWLTCD